VRASHLVGNKRGLPAKSSRAAATNAVVILSSPLLSTSTMSEEQIHKIYIGGLAPTVTEFMLLKVLKTCGKIKSLDFKWHTRTGPDGERKSGTGGYLFAEFFTREAARKAIHLLHNQRVHGRSLVASFAAAKVGMSGAYDVCGRTTDAQDGRDYTLDEGHVDCVALAVGLGLVLQHLRSASVGVKDDLWMLTRSQCCPSPLRWFSCLTHPSPCSRSRPADTAASCLCNCPGAYTAPWRPRVEDYTKNYASDLPAAARAVTGGAEADVEEVQQYQVCCIFWVSSYC
jgi:hypothetical protein